VEKRLSALAAMNRNRINIDAIGMEEEVIAHTLTLAYIGKYSSLATFY
jgi:hypothetical protein